MANHPDILNGATDLTQGSSWQHRVIVDDQAGPWRKSVREAVKHLVASTQPVAWPGQWVLFGFAERRTKAAVAMPDAATLASTPDQLDLDGQPLRRINATCDRRQCIDLAAHFAEPKDGRAAWAFARLSIKEGGLHRIHLSADWRMQWWLDGRPLLDTSTTGNGGPLLERAWHTERELSAGTHTLAGRILSGKGGWGFAGEIEKIEAEPAVPSASFQIESRLAFDVADPQRFVWLTCFGEDSLAGRLNAGEPVMPIGDIRYRHVQGIDAHTLKTGHNELRRTRTREESLAAAKACGLSTFTTSGDARKLKPRARILALPREAAAIRSGPVVTSVGPTHLAINCRTNAPVPCRLTIADRSIDTHAGFFHHWRIEGLSPATQYAYEVSAIDGTGPDAARGGVVRTVGDGPIDLVICADAGPVPAAWQRQAKQIREAAPDAMVFVGDLVNSGDDDWRWDDEFLDPAADLLANVPCLSVPGNHDGGGTLYRQHMLPRTGQPNWSLRIGPAQLIGIDGHLDFSEGSTNRTWLERVLHADQPPFRFVFNHYPTWSSGPHLRADTAGQIVEPPCRQAREVLWPRLQLANVTAIFSGHDHFYERSEPPNGPTCIITGGAGAYLYDRAIDPQQNPHVACHVPVHHHCRLLITDTQAELKAMSCEGRLLDERVWQRRHD